MFFISCFISKASLSFLTMSSEIFSFGSFSLVFSSVRAELSSSSHLLQSRLSVDRHELVLTMKGPLNRFGYYFDLLFEHHEILIQDAICLRLRLRFKLKRLDSLFLSSLLFHIFLSPFIWFLFGFGGGFVWSRGFIRLSKISVPESS